MLPYDQTAIAVPAGVCLTRVREEVVDDPFDLRRVDLGERVVCVDLDRRSDAA